MPRVALFPTCVVDTVASRVGKSAVRVLRALDCQVTVPKDATCCGQPAWNAGFAEEAAAVATTTLEALEAELDAGAEAVVVPAGSCATMMKVFWPELFHLVGDRERRQRSEAVGERVQEFSVFVHGTASGRALGSYESTVAYHHSCHLLRELGVEDQPVALLEGLDGCRAPRWAGDDRCCGFGGLFSVKQPEISVAMADDKLDAIAATGADVVVGCDQSCLLHLEGRARHEGRDLTFLHLAEVLDQALGGVQPS